jgi:hypothetical protein
MAAQAGHAGVNDLCKALERNTVIHAVRPGTPQGAGPTAQCWPSTGRCATCVQDFWRGGLFLSRVIGAPAAPAEARPGDRGIGAGVRRSVPVGYATIT